MAELDHVLARIILSRDADGITAVRHHLPAEFVADLVDLFENRADDPNRWMALASGLGEASLTAASVAAFQHILPLLSLASERAKVYLEWARLEEARGRTREAATHYTTAARLDPTCDEAGRKAKAEFTHSRRYLRALAEENGLREERMEIRLLSAHPGFYAVFVDPAS